MPANEQDDRPPVYFEDPHWIFRLSSLGCLCVTHLAAVALGDLPPRDATPENVRKAWKDGHHYERLLKFRLRDEFGWLIDGEQDVLELPVGTRARIRGHWDGRVSMPLGQSQIPWSLQQQGYDGRPAVLEIKSGHDSSYAKFIMSGLEAFPGYCIQVSVEALVTGLPIIAVMQGKGSLDDLAFRYYPGPIVSVVEPVKKVLAVLAAIDSKQVPKCHGKSMFGNCPFGKHHLPDDPKETVKVEDPAVEAACREYREIGRKIKQLEEEKARYRTIVEACVAANGDKKIKAGSESAGWVESERLDSRALTEDHPDLVARYRQKSKWLGIYGPRLEKDFL